MYLATWKTKNEPELTGNQMIHLQMGILKLFQTLYAMYPCNFIAYLGNNTKENQTVITTTIKPLLETVKMHPMLLISNKDSERQRSWKEMEPHDVVVECSKFSVDDADKCRENDLRGFDGYQAMSISTAHIPVLSGNKNVLSPLDQDLLNADRNRAKPQQKLDTIWSPSFAVLATPPPTNAVTHTPTPTPITPVYGIQTISMGHHQYQPTGASPPEAAVEATPETTPMKDYVKPHRPFPTNSSAARTIWANSSQPSSPLKKDDSTSFRFNENPSAAHLRSFEQEFSPGINSPKLLKLINDRNISQQSLHDRHQQPAHKDTNSNRVFDIEIQHVIETEATVSEQHLRRIPSIETSTEESQEDQEVNEITTRHISQSHSQQIASDSDQGSDETLIMTDRKPRKSLAQCYQKTNVESFDLYRRRAEDNHSESDDDVSNRNISKSWPGLKLKIPRNENKLKTDHVGNGNVQKDLGAIEETEMCSVAIQTTEQYPPSTYEHMYADLLAEELNRKKNSSSVRIATPMSPHNLLDQYIEISTKKSSATDSVSRTDADIQLLSIWLQYERYRRDVYAERNRRLLGKCRDSAALKMDNDKLKVMTGTLKDELQNMSKNLNKARLEQSIKEQKNFAECTRLRSEVQSEREKNKQLEQRIEALERNVKEELDAKQTITNQLEKAQADIFDLKNLLKQCQQQADVGNQYKEEMHRLQAEMALMGEIQMRCKDKMLDISSAHARDTDMEIIKRSYSNEVHGMFPNPEFQWCNMKIVLILIPIFYYFLTEHRTLLEQKSAQLDSTRERVSSLESHITKKDNSFIEQKRLLKIVKEEFQEKIKALDAKYSAQKAIILRLEETIHDLYKYKSAVNTSMQDSEKTGELLNEKIKSIDCSLQFPTIFATSRYGWILRSYIAFVHITGIKWWIVSKLTFGDWN